MDAPGTHRQRLRSAVFREPSAWYIGRDTCLSRIRPSKDVRSFIPTKSCSRQNVCRDVDEEEVSRCSQFCGGKAIWKQQERNNERCI